jgi:hypothetical protein
MSFAPGGLAQGQVPWGRGAWEDPTQDHFS